MKISTPFLFLLLAVSISATAFGQSFKPDSWQSIIGQLRASGVDRVGQLDLLDLEHKIGTRVQWKDIQNNTRPEFAGARNSAYYIIEDNTVYIGRKIPNDLIAAEPQLELHEALGALGYNDRDYALSSSLDLLSKIRDKRAREYVIDSLGQSVFSKKNLSRSSGSGSGSGVGGGGDITAISAKNLVLNEILADRQILLSAFINLYPYIQFEPKHSKKEKVISIGYSRGKNLKNLFGLTPGHNPDIRPGQMEVLTIWVPVHEWSKGGRTRKRLTQEIANRILEMMPVKISPNRRTRTIAVCNNQQYTYIEPSAGYIDIIQNLRAEALMGCDSVFPDFSIIVPEFDTGYTVNGSPRYLCTHKYGNRKIQEKVVAARDLNGDPFGLTVFVDENYNSFNGRVDWHPDGSLKNIGIKVVGSDISATSHRNIQYSKHSRVVRAKGRSGKIYSFGCEKTR